jgi:hypothetical protein
MFKYLKKNCENYLTEYKIEIDIFYKENSITSNQAISKAISKATSKQKKERTNRK